MEKDTKQTFNVDVQGILDKLGMKKTDLEQSRKETEKTSSKQSLEEMKKNDLEQSPKETKKGLVHPCYFRAIFAIRLSEELERKKMQLVKTAKKLEIAQASFSDYCSAKAEPKISSFAKIAVELDVSADYLLGRTDIQSVELDIQKTCTYTGLSDSAAKKLNEYSRNSQDPLIMDIISYLIENEILGEISHLLGDGLVRKWQYGMLYDTEEEKRKLLNIDEFQFNQKVMEFYSTAIEELDKNLSQKIERIAIERVKELKEIAEITIEKMNIILDALSDPTVESYIVRRRIEEAD